MSYTIDNIMKFMSRHKIKPMLQYSLAIMLMLLVSLEVKATHIVGGDFTYRQIGDETFEVTLTIRRDCINGADDAQFDTLAIVSIYDENGDLAAFPPLGGYLKIPFMGSDTLDNIFESDCGFLGSQVCVHEAVYRDTVYLPDLGKGYLLAYQRCCRNITLNNVVDPTNTGATHYIEIPHSVYEDPNSSPVFNEWPDLYICADQELVFDHSATDPDGDELRYKLCTPSQGATMEEPMPQGAPPPPYAPVDWLSPFNLSDLMGGDPLVIDPITGIITARPNMVGQYLVGICVEEYRDGVKIGETRRDFEYNVRVCEDAPMASFDPPTGICDGNLTVDFVNTSTGAIAYEWFFDFPNMDPAFISTEENPTFTYPEEGSYTVKLIAYRGTDECQDEFTYVINAIDANISAQFKAFIAECQEDGSVVIGLSDLSVDNTPGFDIVDWQYTLEQNGNTQVLDGADVEFNVDPTLGDPVVTLVVTSSSDCTASASQTIDIDQLTPVVDFSVDAQGCPTPELLRFTLTDLSSGLNTEYVPVSWAWTVVSTEGTEDLSGPSVTLELDPYQVITATLAVTFDNDCIVEVTKEINLEDLLPQVDFSTLLTSCLDDGLASFLFSDISGMIPDNPSSPTMWSWIVTLADGTELTSSDQTIAFETSPFQTISAELEVIFENGCVAKEIKEINLEDLLPSASYALDALACDDDGTVEVQFTDTSTDPGGASVVSVDWSIGTISNIQDFSGSPITLTIPKDSLIYITQIVAFSNGCIDTLDEAIVPGPFASLQFNGNPVMACIGGETPLLTNANPDWTYTWEPIEGLDFSNGDHDPFYVGTEDMTYNVTVTDGLCTEMATIDVIAMEASDIEITGDLFNCEGNVDLTASGGVGEGEYEWVLADDPDNVIFVGPNLVTTFEGDNVTYIVSFTGTDCPSDPVEVTVSTLDIDIDLIEPFQICRGDSIQFEVFNNDPTQILTWLWADDPHITAGNDTATPTIEIGPDETEPFGLAFTVTNQFGCTLMDTLDIVIVDMPILSFEGDLTECGELEMCFTITSDIFGFAVWDFGDPTTEDDVSLDMMPCYTYPDFGTYTVTLSNTSGICQAEPVQMDITINPLIVLTDIEDVTACEGDEITLTAESNVEDVNTVWCNEAGDTLFIGNPYIFTAESDMDVFLKVTDVNDCSDTDQISIEVFDFDLDVEFPEIFCAEEEVLVTVTNNSDGDLTYQWGPEDCVISGGDTATPVLTASGDNKIFTLIVTNPDTGCEMEFTYDIPVNDVEVEVDADPDVDINQGEEVDIFVVDADPDITYVWDNGVEGAEQTVMPLDTTTYVVTATDENGCTDTASITINVRQPKCDDTDVYLPNAFTPNDDGTNDILFLRSNFIESMRLVIYDRWGKEVFSTTDQSIGWDGTLDGEKLAPDAYAYILDVVCVNQVEYFKKGNVTILR